MYLIHSLRVGHCCKVLLICLLHGEKHVALLEEDEPQLVQVGVALQPQLILPPGPTNSYLPDNSLFLNLGYTFLNYDFKKKKWPLFRAGEPANFFPAPRFFSSGSGSKGSKKCGSGSLLFVKFGEIFFPQQTTNIKLQET